MLDLGCINKFSISYFVWPSCSHFFGQKCFLSFKWTDMSENFGPGSVQKKRPTSFHGWRCSSIFVARNAPQFFSSFFRGRLDSQKTLLAGECPKFTRPDLFQSFFGLKWSLRHASFESGHEILSCDYLLTCRLSVVLRPD